MYFHKFDLADNASGLSYRFKRRSGLFSRRFDRSDTFFRNVQFKLRCLFHRSRHVCSFVVGFVFFHVSLSVWMEQHKSDTPFSLFRFKYPANLHCFFPRNHRIFFISCILSAVLLVICFISFVVHTSIFFFFYFYFEALKIIQFWSEFKKENLTRKIKKKRIL